MSALYVYGCVLDVCALRLRVCDGCMRSLTTGVAWMYALYIHGCVLDLCGCMPSVCWMYADVRALYPQVCAGCMRSVSTSVCWMHADVCALYPQMCAGCMRMYALCIHGYVLDACGCMRSISTGVCWMYALCSHSASLAGAQLKEDVAMQQCCSRDFPTTAAAVLHHTVLVPKLQYNCCIGLQHIHIK